MSFGPEIYQHLSNDAAVVALNADRISPLVRGKGSTHIVYNTLSETLPVNLDLSDGLKEATVQIDCWSGVYLTANVLADAVTNSLHKSAVLGNTPVNRIFRTDRKNTFAPDAEGYYRVMLIFSIYFN